MIYPLIKLTTPPTGPTDERDAEERAVYIQPARITSFGPKMGGGTNIYTDDGNDAPFVVTQSPSQINAALNETIRGAGELGTFGAIRAQIQAQQELSKNASGIALPGRGFNGG